MTDNILKKHVERTSKELVSDMSLSLADNASAEEMKNARFRVSAEGPDGSNGKSRPDLGLPENIFRPMFSGVP